MTLSTNKYEITDTVHQDNPNLKRIRALRDIPRHGIKKGDLGGYIESEHNLSHDGDCWISGSAVVYGNAEVYGKAWVTGIDRITEGSRV